jgi:hypothetical protein
VWLINDEFFAKLFKETEYLTYLQHQPEIVIVVIDKEEGMSVC